MTLDEHQLDEDGEHDPDACEVCYECNHSIKSTCDCGRCCEGLLIEVSLRDAEREPRIKTEASPTFCDLRTSTKELIGYPMVVFAAHTGARRSEMLRSKIRDVDFESGKITIREKKRDHSRSTTRRVPMSPVLRQVLKAWLHEHPGGPSLFCDQLSLDGPSVPPAITHDAVHDHFKRTLAGSKWSRMRGWHCLRHSFASNCAAKGIDQRVINAWMGHAGHRSEIERRYHHLIPNQEQLAITTVFG
jgi:integrase